jgi:hypothetical protein
MKFSTTLIILVLAIFVSAAPTPAPSPMPQPGFGQWFNEKLTAVKDFFSSGGGDGLLCDFETIKATFEKKSSEQSISQIRAKFSELLEKVPAVEGPISLRNPFSQDLYYRFAAYQSLTYMENASTITGTSGMLIEGNSFYTGNIKLLQRGSMDGYKAYFHNGDDAVYTVIANEEQKLIVLSWRGSVVYDDWIADFRSKSGVKPDERFFDPEQCGGATVDDDFTVGSGFEKSLPQEVLDKVISDLREAKSLYPDFSLVETGHSLGASKALLFALHLKLHTEMQFEAVYTYGMPITGSTSFNDYAAECIGVNRFVRIVSSDDIVPIISRGVKMQHSQKWKEVYAPKPAEPEWVICQGSKDGKCSFTDSCGEKKWDHHSVYAEFEMSLIDGLGDLRQ